MSEESEAGTAEGRRELADALKQPIDPLAEAESAFRETELDPFALFREEVLAERDLADSTRRHFAMIFAEWREFMEREGRHPACPNPDHVEAYIDWQTGLEAEGGKDNAHRTVKEKLRKLNQVYRYWQDDAAFPHPDGYNPINVARERNPLPVRKEKEHRRIPVSELREMVDSVTNLRSRAIIAMQLKLGLRAGEMANIRLEDIRMNGAETAAYYDSLGTYDRLGEHEDVIYVPSKHERKGNKSSRPRLLPLDSELRNLLDRYLLVRPDNGEPWAFLSVKSHSKMDSKGVNGVWKEAFHPEFRETEDHRPVTSHFGRHRFTTSWRVEQDVNRQLVKYMRGDRTGAYRNDRGLNAYLHAYNEDIEGPYRDGIFHLGCGRLSDG